MTASVNPSPPASLTAIFRHLSFVRETQGPNRGAWVGFCQRFCGGAAGDSWCAQILAVVLDIAFGGKSPLRKSSACQDLLNQARTNGWIVAEPQPDDLVFSVDVLGHAHHVGVVTAVAPLTAIAGNTSPDGTSANGTGVFEHPISPIGKVFVRL